MCVKARVVRYVGDYQDVHQEPHKLLVGLFVAVLFILGLLGLR
jgi:hypothetical protein